MTATPEPAAFPAAVTSRVFRAPIERVFRAWLDPAVVGQWMAPGAVDRVEAHIDPRPGGTYQVWQYVGGEPMGGFDARIVELDAPHRLVFDWAFVAPDRGRDRRYDSRLTVTLSESGDGTLLELVHENLTGLARDLPDVAGKVEVGWAEVLAKLDGVLS